MKKVTHKTAGTESPNPQQDGNIVGGGLGKTTNQQKRIILTVAGVVTVLLALFGFIIYSQLYPSAQKVKSTYNGNTDFSTMSPEEVPGNIQPILGVSEKDLRTKTLTSSMIPTFDKSFSAANALIMLKEPKRALSAMKLAESQMGKAKLPDERQVNFYYQYALIALDNSDEKQAKNHLATARKILDNSKITSSIKTRYQKTFKLLEQEIDMS